MSTLAAFLWATGAGFAISILDYAALAAVPRRFRRASFTDLPYLFKFFGHPLIGGFLATAYVQGRSETTPWTVVIIGAAAPSIWRTLVRSGSGMAKVLLKQMAEDENAQ
jgi:hypothetical protein